MNTVPQSAALTCTRTCVTTHPSVSHAPHPRAVIVTGHRLARSAQRSGQVGEHGRSGRQPGISSAGAVDTDSSRTPRRRPGGAGKRQPGEHRHYRSQDRHARPLRPPLMTR